MYQVDLVVIQTFLLMSARISNKFHYVCDYIESSPKRLFPIFKPSFYTELFFVISIQNIFDVCCENNHNNTKDMNSITPQQEFPLELRFSQQNVAFVIKNLR